jgi:hypothetical protein
VRLAGGPGDVRVGRAKRPLPLSVCGHPVAPVWILC